MDAVLCGTGFQPVTSHGQELAPFIGARPVRWGPCHRALLRALRELRGERRLPLSASISVNLRPETSLPDSQACNYTPLGRGVKQALQKTRPERRRARPNTRAPRHLPRCRFPPESFRPRQLPARGSSRTSSILCPPNFPELWGSPRPLGPAPSPSRRPGVVRDPGVVSGCQRESASESRWTQINADRRGSSCSSPCPLPGW